MRNGGVYIMGDEFRQCYDRDHCERDRCYDDKDFKHDCDCHDFDDDCGSEWDWGTWIPIIIIIFLLCGGTNIFGGNGCRDDCNDNIFGSGWILILIVIFFLFSNQKDCKGGGGFLGLF